MFPWGNYGELHDLLREVTTRKLILSVKKDLFMHIYLCDLKYI